MGDDCYLDENAEDEAESEVEESEAKEPEAKEPEAKEPEAKEPEAKEPEQPVVHNMDDQEEPTGRIALELLCRRDDSGEKVEVLVSK